MKYEQGLAKAIQKRNDSGDSLGLWTKLGEMCFELNVLQNSSKIFFI